MNPFTYHNLVRIHFGSGSIAKLSAEIPPGTCVLLVYGGGSIKANGVHAQVLAALAGRQIVEFGGIEPNPHYTTCRRAIELARTSGAQQIVAVGGGSVIDAAKFIAAGACLPEGEDPWSIFTGRAIEQALPLGTVVTLAATGSEANCLAVITHDERGEKRVFGHPRVFPQFSILDPDTTASLPLRQRINGVIDPWVHVLEQYLTFPQDAAVQDRCSEALLHVLRDEGPKALREPADPQARANVMWAASLALNGLNGSGVAHDWAAHLIGHELTTLYGLDHAQSLAITHPAVLKYCHKAKAEKLLQYGERIFGIASGSREERIAATIAAEEAFFEGLGAPTRLSAYGIGRSELPRIAAAVAPVIPAMGMRGLGEHQAITADQLEELLLPAL